MWTDSHCHVPYEGLDATPEEVFAEARAAGVDRMITVGTDAVQSARAVEAAHVHDGVWATVGLHPHDASWGAATIEPLLAPVGASGRPDPVIVAIGECGLDYFYEHSPRAAQRDAFAAQIALAHHHRLALVVHTRDAWEDTFDILGAEGPPERTIIHCFTGGVEEARRCLDLGAWLSFSGIVTFKGAVDVRAAAALCPLGRTLVETDSPFLAPVPHRGRPNHPAYVTVVGAAVAAAQGHTVEEVRAATAANADVVFALPGRRVDG